MGICNSFDFASEIFSELLSESSRIIRPLELTSISLDISSLGKSILLIACKKSEVSPITVIFKTVSPKFLAIFFLYFLDLLFF